MCKLGKERPGASDFVYTNTRGSAARFVATLEARVAGIWIDHKEGERVHNMYVPTRESLLFEINGETKAEVIKFSS
jgi:hypothetical protein